MKNNQLFKNIKFLFLLFAILLSSNTTIIAQDKTVNISGVIVDTDGEAIIGASILVLNTREGTVSDIDGNFKINTQIGKTLQISYIGYKSVEQKIISSAPLKIVMEEDINEVDEIVVIGYGVQKRSDLTASISSVKSGELASTSTTSLDQGLQGRAAGVVVLNTSGQPGGATSIRIRGTSSINGTNEPLYVIDGVPIISDPYATSAGGLKNPASNPLTSINPNDIESLEVLKDASATSIYGARGANGVILITTKQGKSGKAKVALSMRYMLQQVSKKMDMLNSVQLAELANEAADNDGVERRPVFADLNNLAKRNTNWQDEIFRTAPMQSYDVSISGGGETNTYFTSANVLKQDGIILGSNYDKGTLRFNFEQKLGKYIKVGLNANTTYSRSNGVVTNSEGAFASSVTSWALEMNPALPVRDSNGRFIYENNTSPTSNVGNPVQDALEAINKTTSLKLLTNAYVEVRPFKDLILKSSFGIDYFNVKDQAFAAKELKRAESNNGYASIANRDGYTWVSENTATYLKSFGKHSFNALAGMTAQAFTSEYSNVAVADFEDGTLGFHDLGAAALKQMAISGISEWQMLSYLARINYNYDNRYLFTLTGRIDGSSKFGKDNKFGTFPSAAVAWRASEEKFMKDITLISNLKARASYGLVGNEGIPPYSSQGLLYSTEAYIGNSQIIKGKVPFTRSNKDLKWETTSQMNLGFDIGFFDGRIAFTADYYHKNTKDLLLYMPDLLHSGYDMSMKNVGSMENSGYEFTLNLIPVTNKHFTWTSDFTMGFNKNKITDLANSKENLVGNPVLGITYWTKITKGKPIGTIYGYKTDGIVQKNEDPSKIPFFPGKTLQVGDRKYVNRNSDNVLNEDDLFELGNANPDFSFGFTNSFKYNLPNSSALNLSVFLQGVVGNEIVNFNRFALESLDGYKNNSTEVLNRWTPDNPTNKYPRATMKSHGNVLSDHYVEDGSYLRVKNVNLTYDFSRSLARKFFMEALSVYVSVQNIYTFTNYTGYDPEVSRFSNNNLSMGADYGSYPMAKSFEFGARINF